VAHAVAQNISVRQSDIQARLTALQVKQTDAGRYPNIAFSTDAGYRLGRSINPATNTFENQSIFFTQFGLQSGITLFNWFSQRYASEAARLDQKAAEAVSEKARNDIALNVAVGYLQALLASEQVEISRVQIGQTAAQLETVRKQVRAGSLPELNALELEAQLARDSAAFISSEATYRQNIILLKALLSLDMAVPFDIEKPAVDQIPVEPLAELQPQAVYEQALKNLPQQRVNQYRFQSAQKNIQVARASMYPTLSGFASLNTSYSSLFPDQQRMIVTPTGKFDTTNLIVEVSPGNFRRALSPGVNVLAPNAGFGRQLFVISPGQAVGISLNVPILQGRQLRSAWERARLQADNIRLQMDLDNLTLQQDIYSAYNDAVNALQRYRAAQKAVEAAERAFSFSQRRYEVGLLQTIELITNQNNLYRSRLDALAARYEYVFRMKLLEFYKGQGLKL
jgi:outer membrane protein